MKAMKPLIAGLCLFAGAAVQFCLAFSVNSAGRILNGVLFSTVAFLAWREWNKERKGEQDADCKAWQDRN